VYFKKDEKVLEIMTNLLLHVSFLRPEELATDIANSYDIIIHTLKYYKSINKFFGAILPLQPTTPIRSYEDFYNLIKCYSESIDKVITIKN
jgi:CMP-N,N'-diacetyllegionaminic acid synthase